MQHGQQGGSAYSSANTFNQYQSQAQAAARGLAGSTQPYNDTPPPMSVSSLGPPTPGVNSAAASYYAQGNNGANSSLASSMSFGGGLGAMNLGHTGMSLGGGLGNMPTSMPSQLAAVQAQHQSQQQEESKIYQLVIDLLDVDTRETALLELSKKREQYDHLALLLWHSYGKPGLQC